MRVTDFSFAGWALLVVLMTIAGVVAQEPMPNEPEILPAQFLEPGARGPIVGMPVGGSVVDPATPMVRIQVRTPSHIAPGKSVPYRIIVTNTSSATAYKVRVRHPLPEHVSAVATKIEPPADQTVPYPAGTAGAGKTLPKEYVWEFMELRAGQSKEIQLEYPVMANAKNVRATAFVSFEHGQTVTTEIDKPKLAINKVAPEKAVAGEPITVRVEVTNNSQVPVQAVRLLEQVPPGFVFSSDGESESGTAPGQRVWNLGTFGPGQRKLVEYRVTSKDAAELSTTSNVSSKDTPTPETSSSTTKVLMPKMLLEFTGPQTVPAGDTGAYVVKVTNTGNLALRSIRVTVTMPADCTVTNKTTGGNRYKDQLVWDLPADADRSGGPLQPGQTAEVRFRLKAATTGTRTIIASAEAGRGLEQAQKVTSSFQGSSLLQYKTSFEPGTVTVGKPAILTYIVENLGDEAAKKVVLRIELPKGFKTKEISPNYTVSGNEVTFAPVSVPARGDLKFSITYTPEVAERAEVTFKLFAESLEKPLVKTSNIVVRSAARD